MEPIPSSSASGTGSRHIDARLYLRILWKRKALWLLPPVIILCTVAIAVNVVPPVYEAVATVYYDDKPNLTRQMQELTGLGGSGYARADELAQERQQDMSAKIRSRPFLEHVAHTLRLNQDPEAIREGQKIQRKRSALSVDEAVMDLLVQNLRARLHVEAAGATVFNVIARDNDPQNAQLLAKWVSQLFVDATTHGQMQQIRAAGDFSQEQLAVYEKKLRAAEDALRAFQESMLGHQLAANPVSEKNRDQARALIRQAEAEVADLQEQSRALPAAARASASRSGLGGARGLRGPAKDLDREECDLGVQLLDKPPSDVSVMAQKERVGSTRQELYDRLTSLVAGRYSSLSATDQGAIRDALYTRLQLHSILVRRQKLQAYLDGYEKNFRQAPREQLELDRLRQDVETNRSLLQAFRNQSTSSRISEAVESTNLGMRVEVLEQPGRPLEPVSPNAPRAFVMALILGPLLGFGSVFLAEYLDSSYRTVEDLELDLGLPVVGTIPRLEEPHRLLGARRRWMPLTVSAAVALTVVFFVLKFTLFPELGRFHHSAQAREPGSAQGTAGQ